MSTGITARRKTFVENGEPFSVMGPAIREMRREGDALVLSPAEAWGNPLFADCALAEEDFHIHARLTLGKLEGTGASFLIGGFFHYPCSRPEGNQAFRVSLDDEFATYDPYTLETDAQIVYGMTERRAPWSEAKKKIAGRTSDHIEAGKPFTIDLHQKGREAVFQINGRSLFRIDLRKAGWLSGSGDGGWPICFGFLPDQGEILLHDFHADGVFSQSALDHEDVWMMGHDGYFTYRIPSLCVTPRGSVLAFAEARRSDFSRAWGWSKEWNADAVHCVMKRSTDGGRTWGAQNSILACGTRYEARDPAPVADRETGDIFLITRGPYILKSRDDGESWSEPRSLRALCRKNMNYLSPGPGNSGIQLRRGRYAGRLVIAVATAGDVGVIFSDDHGENWTLGGISTGCQGFEPQVAELADGRILLNSRNHSDKPGRILSISSNGGARFEEHYDHRLPAKRCQASLLCGTGTAGKSGKEAAPIVFCAPGEGRRMLTVKLSDDGCESWPISRGIYSGQSAYSAMAFLPDGQVGILYEKDAYRRLSFVRFPLGWLRGPV